jgi:hypothetical protein
VRELALSPDAVRQFRALSSRDRRILKDALRQQLQEDDATRETRNRFRLRRPSPFAEFELRVRDLRAFYRVLGNEVQIVLIGRKKGSDLIIGGRRFVL